MTGFPNDEPLELTAEVAWGADLTADPTAWSWTPLGLDTVLGVPRLLDTPITHQHGTAVGASSSQTMSASIQCLNNDGYLTPELATSPWWPYVDAGTPIRLRMRTKTTPYLVDTFTRTVVGGWGTTDDGHTYVYSGGSGFSANGTQGKISFSATNVIRQAESTTLSPRDADVLFDCAVNATSSGIANVIGPHLRWVDNSNYLWPTVEFQTNGLVELKVRATIAGVFTQLAYVTTTGVAYSAGTLIRCRVQIVADRLRMRCWLASGTEPSTWHIDIRQTTYAAAGPFGFLAWVILGNTNTLPVIFTVDNVTVSQPPYDRVEGYIADVKPTYEPQSGGTTWSTVTIDIGGIGSRLEKNQSPSYSPARRSVQLSYPPPIAYWPCEDAEGSLSAASAFPQQPAMQVTGPAVFAFASDTPTDLYLSRFGTKPMVSLAAGAKLTGVVPLSTVQTEWAVSCIAEFYVPGIPATFMRILAWETAGSALNRWAIVGTDVGYMVRAYNDAAGTATDVAVYAGVFIGQFTMTCEVVQNGANIDVQLRANDVLLASGSIAGTLRAVSSRIFANPDRSNTTASVDPHGIKFVVGHIRVLDNIAVRDLPFYTDPDQSIIVDAGNAWYLESAHRRINRLCEEERVAFQWVGNPQGSGLTILNAQRDGGFTDLITQAADSESGGLLYEAHFGYEYLPRSVRYNRAADLTIDMAVYKYSDGTDPAAVLVPQLDSRATNYWTISRTNGSSGAYAATAAYRLRRGTIAEERTLDVLTDDVLVDHAGWRTHVNVDGQGARYPAVPVDLAANPELIEAFLAVGIGSRVQRLNQPTVAGYGTIDQVVEGISETLSPTSWQATLTCAPGDVWDVAVFDDPVRRQDSASTVTNASYAAGVTTIVFKTTNVGDLWSTTTEPYDCLCAGVRFTVTVMGAATGTGPYLQPATVVRGVGGVDKLLPADEPIHMHPDQLARIAL
jgi:hypothetical protein